jgi:hypothetical protein
MNQSINILRKDAYLLWPEITISIVLLALFTVIEPKGWVVGPPMLLSMAALANVLTLALCMSWAVMMISLIQAERLVGLNQFWTTRPYEWPKLIAAKCYFLLALLYLPLVVSQAILLHLAGIPVPESIPAMLHNLLLLTIALVLPICCAAAITRSIGQALLALLAFGAMLAGIEFYATSFRTLAPHALVSTQIGIAAVLLIAALANQYRYRATARSLFILTLAPALIVLLQAVLPGTPLAVQGYATPGARSPIAVQFDMDPQRATGSPLSSAPNARPLLHLPLLVSGVASDSSIGLDGHKLTLVGADGYRWQTPWLAESGMIGRGSGDAARSSAVTAYSEFEVPREVYARLAGGPVLVRIAFAVVPFGDQPATHSTLSVAENAVPGLGSCALDESYSYLSCRSAFHQPPNFIIQTERRLGPCKDEAARTEPATGEMGDSRAPALPHISPVVVNSVRLSTLRPGFLCPGLPIDYVERRMAGRVKVETPAASLDLKRYVGSIRIPVD